MIQVKFRYGRKTVTKSFYYEDEIADYTLGKMEPTDGVIYGNTVGVNKTKLKKFIKDVTDIVEGVFIEENIKTFLKEKKSGNTGKSKKAKEPIQE